MRQATGRVASAAFDAGFDASLLQDFEEEEVWMQQGKTLGWTILMYRFLQSENIIDDFLTLSIIILDIYLTA